MTHEPDILLWTPWRQDATPEKAPYRLPECITGLYIQRIYKEGDTVENIAHAHAAAYSMWCKLFERQPEHTAVSYGPNGIGWTEPFMFRTKGKPEVFERAMKAWSVFVTMLAERFTPRVYFDIDIEPYHPWRKEWFSGDPWDSAERVHKLSYKLAVAVSGVTGSDCVFSNFATRNVTVAYRPHRDRPSIRKQVDLVVSTHSPCVWIGHPEVYGARGLLAVTLAAYERLRENPCGRIILFDGNEMFRGEQGQEFMRLLREEME